MKLNNYEGAVKVLAEAQEEPITKKNSMTKMNNAGEIQMIVKMGIVMSLKKLQIQGKPKDMLPIASWEDLQMGIKKTSVGTIHL